MNYFQKSSQEVNKVYKTNDLNLFKTIKGNRPPNPQHIRRLVDSIKTNGILCNPILINESFEVIDGQHRLEAAKQANSLIYYFILDGYELKEVHALNLNQKNWTKKDFMSGYCEMGIESYVKLKDFYKKNKDYTLTNCIQFCSNISSSSSSSIHNKYRKGNLKNLNIKEIFEEGTWIGKDFDLGKDLANKVRLSKPYYKGYNRAGYVSALIGLIIYKSDVFDFNTYMHKLRLQPNALLDCTSVSSYKMLIEDIYNYRNREKVNLRF